MGVVPLINVRTSRISAERGRQPGSSPSTLGRPLVVHSGSRDGTGRTRGVIGHFLALRPWLPCRVGLVVCQRWICCPLKPSFSSSRSNPDWQCAARIDRQPPTGRGARQMPAKRIGSGSHQHRHSEVKDLRAGPPHQRDIRPKKLHPATAPHHRLPAPRSPTGRDV